MPRDLLAEQSQAQQPRDLLAGMPTIESKRDVSLHDILSRNVMRPRFIKPQEAITQAGGMSPYLQAIRQKLQAVPLGARQESARMLGKIPGQALHQYLAQSALTPQQQQITQKYPEYAQTGRLGADVAAPSLMMGAAPEGAAAIGAGALAGAGAAPSGTVPTALGAAAGGLAPFAPKIAEGLDEGLGKIGQWFKSGMSANKYTKNLLGDLGQGSGVEENAQNLASKVKDIKETISKYFTNKYADLTNRAGSESLYDETQPAEKGTYRSLKSWKKSPIDTYSSTIKKAHEDFDKMPTFENAHKLQSVLGSEARRVWKKPALNLQDEKTVSGWQDARQRVLGDMHNHLNSVDPSGNLSKNYNDISNEYLEEAVPYKENTAIKNIAAGRITNPRNLTPIFKNPEGDVQKVVNDLGSEGKNQILYNELYERKPTPKKILDNYDKLDKKGLKSYVSPSLERQMEILKRKVTTGKWVKRGVGLAGAGYLAHKLFPVNLARQILS